MPKKGQHRDGNDPRISRGHNNPEKSQTITTGTYKKSETYRKQAAEHENPNKEPQHQELEWRHDTRQHPPDVHETRARHLRGRRSGSRSNENSGTRGH